MSLNNLCGNKKNIGIGEKNKYMQLCLNLDYEEWKFYSFINKLLLLMVF